MTHPTTPLTRRLRPRRGQTLRKIFRETLHVGAAETPRGGRPTKLTPELCDQLLAQLATGAGLAEAASASGISARTLRSWRQRAWSPRPEDRPYVELEQRLRDARTAVAPVGSTDPEAWRSTAEILEANERAWADLFADA
jgi:transposase-like protein